MFHFFQTKNLMAQKNKIFIGLIVIFFVCAYLVDSQKAQVAPSGKSDHHLDVDTFIPNGFVLVMIEIQNRTALDSMIGQYGVVDLYLSGQAHPLARGLRLIRSPKDPSQFGVLVRDDRSREIVRLSDKPFQVVLQNPKQIKTQLENKKTSAIQWED